MDRLKQRVLEDGQAIGTDILKVDSFLNHQLDVALIDEIGHEFHDRFADLPITRILTVEASGIAVACATARLFRVPVVFAKKSVARTQDDSCYQAESFSYTRGGGYIMRVNRRFLQPCDCVLIVDDFLANGRAVLGLADIIRQAGAKLGGVGIVIEKGFQEGGRQLRDEGLRVESLVTVTRLSNGIIELL